MHYNCTMTTSRVIAPANEEGADVEGVEEARGVAVSVWASLRLTVAVFMAHIMEKCVDSR